MFWRAISPFEEVTPNKTSTMGMDLEPIAPTDKHPLDSNGEPRWGRYNWSGWNYLGDFLEKHGCDVELAGMNDGEELSAEDCKRVAQCIEDNVDTLDARDKQWLSGHIALWRECGGYRQF